MTYENTRALGIGETVLPTDFWSVPITQPGEKPELMMVDEPEVGLVVTGEELYDYRRSLQGDPWEMIYTELGLITDCAKEAFKIACENIKLMDRKQMDYGSGNITAFGEFGVLVRMNDKIERLKHLNKMPNPKNESIEDSYMDLSNYAIIAMMIRRNIWK